MRKIKKFKKKFDGTDWLYKWNDGLIYGPEDFNNPVEACVENISLFMSGYVPKNGDVVIDLGAGLGTELQFLSELVGDSGKLISIEADPKVFEKLVKTSKKLKLSNNICLNKAVWSYKTRKILSQEHETGLTNSLVDNNQVGIEVETETLEQILLENNLTKINFLKINIEGAEFEALKSLGARLDDVENFCISCHDFTGIENQLTFKKVHEFLLLHGFDYIRTIEYNEKRPWEGYYIFAGKRKLTQNFIFPIKLNENWEKKSVTPKKLAKKYRKHLQEVSK